MASLLSVLRNDLNLTGSKYGCGEGQCGACTVLIDGQPARSCITQVGRVSGKQITTIEGLEKDGRLHPLQEAFLKADAMQCAYCTSGMIMSSAGLLQKKPATPATERRGGGEGGGGGARPQGSIADGFENGKITNPRFSIYRVPRFRDMPLIEVVLIDRKDVPSAGAGETPIVGLAPAVGNAIFSATGIRLRSLPLAPKGLPATA